MVQAHFLTLAVATILGLPNVSAYPTQPSVSLSKNAVSSDLSAVEVGKRQDRPLLRILSLGASIMAGQGSSNGNGLRKPLRDALRFDGFEVNMVGAFQEGVFFDRDHEAVRGEVVTAIHDRMRGAAAYEPNIIIINAGTNDALQSVDVGNTGNRMNDMLNTIWDSPNMADTCVMLSTLLDTQAAEKPNRDSINDQYRDVVARRSGEGRCIYLADMDPEGPARGWINFDTDYDQGEAVKIHPNDEGHRKMASIFHAAISRAAGDGRIVGTANPINTNLPDARGGQYGNGDDDETPSDPNLPVQP